MTQYLYVIDTSIVDGSGVAVGQTAYDLLVDERLLHGVIPLLPGEILGAGTTWIATPGIPDVGIHTTKNVGIATTASRSDISLYAPENAYIGVATVGVATIGGVYEVVRPTDKILSPSQNAVALTDIVPGNNNINIDTSQQTVAIGTIGSTPRYNFTNVSLQTSRMCEVSIIGLGSGPGAVSAGTEYTINGGPIKNITWATTSVPNFESSNYNIVTFKILQDSVGLTSVFGIKEGG